jgi:hypothetical protein
MNDCHVQQNEDKDQGVLRSKLNSVFTGKLPMKDESTAISTEALN